MKRIIPCILIALLFLTSCGAEKKDDLPFDEVGVGFQDDTDYGVGDVEYPTQYFGVEFTEQMKNTLCWDYSILNSVLVASNDPSLVAGFNKEDMLGTLIYKLYPELESIPSIIKDGQIDIEAVKASGSEYIILSDESAAEYKSVFEDAGLQTYSTSKFGESATIGHNAVSFICIGANMQERLQTVSTKYFVLGSEEIQEALKEVPFSDRKSVLFLGDAMTSVYTAECALQIMDRCGAVNAAADIEITDGYLTSDGVMTARYTEATVQQINQWNPDVIWVPYFADYTAEDVLNNPEYQNITAVKNKAVYTFPGALEPWYYPTVSNSVGTFWATYTLYPEICPYESVLKAANSYYSDVFGAQFTEEEMGLYKIS